MTKIITILGIGLIIGISLANIVNKHANADLIRKVHSQKDIIDTLRTENVKLRMTVIKQNRLKTKVEQK